MSNAPPLPEFVKFTIQAKGTTYWAIHDTGGGCDDCSFYSETALFCRKVADSNNVTFADGMRTSYPCNGGTASGGDDTVVFVHPRFVKSITAKLVAHRLSPAHKE